VVFAACNDPLEVENVNNPDRSSVLNLPRDVEALGGRLYQNSHAATIGPNEDRLYQQMLTMSFENASSLNNYGMGPRSSIPRSFIDNTIGNNFSDGNYRTFRDLQVTARTAMSVLAKINEAGFTLGDTAQDRRLRSFTWFGYAIALGDVALVHDSAGIPQVGEEDTFVPVLVGYDSVMRAAIRALDSAQTNANASMPAIPAEWLAQSTSVTRANFVRLIRAYKAKFRAQVARTPQERAAVNWAQVVADAENGLAADFVMQLNPGAGWNYGWLIQHMTTGAAAWHQMVPYIINMADTTGAFDAWLATPRDTRQPFLIRTPDRRFPAGETRAAQTTNSPALGAPAIQYLRNRPAGEDVANTGWNTSFYDHNRWRALRNANRVGEWVGFSKVENDMNAAEGHIRLGNIAAARDLINTSRARVSLPPLTVTSATERISGSACVPRVPVAPTYTVTACGTILDALKWEKRMETAYASWGSWFFDGRGWGDLPEGTAVHWPVPWQELAARELPIYTYGGVGNPGSAAPSTTYGFGSGNR
jgi:hypothetical protein